jgi:hypothetical protein
MKRVLKIILILVSGQMQAQDHALIAKVESIRGLIALWDFKEPAGESGLH